ncbi:putative RNA methyltransferase [Nitzschia inconspicua]|uniref:RNA methyltransferase n=1 Tax=Nitzschia inconspicua TaxID=303405 RepID=A0A9K3M4K4_9STRA|nr:putative RNA methyltransferase [Nitzschia inconspicua]
MLSLSPEQQALSRKQRKIDGKQRKRRRIEESGGKRPRTLTTGVKDMSTDKHSSISSSDKNETSRKTKGGSPFLRESTSGSFNTKTTGPPRGKNRNGSSSFKTSTNSTNKHRFGRVMEQVPCRNKPRYSTLSIALPGSVLANCQTKELRTLLVGQIARAATIYHVDEVVVFDDKLGADEKQQQHNNWRDFKRRNNNNNNNNNNYHHPSKEDDTTENKKDGEPEEDDKQQEQQQMRLPKSNSQEFMARLLQYCECPQYLRRSFFPMHPDLQFAGLLAPVDAPHHVRADDRSKYREGVVLDKISSNGNSLVNCGIRNRPVEIDRKISPGVRCTVELDKSAYTKPGQIHGTVVSPSAPREDDGTYWGYTTRLATSIHDVFESCPYEAGYDLKIGTSERGDKSVEDAKFGIPKFEHSLIVFGGVAGIEECVDADESLKVSGSHSRTLFDVWLNVCPYQGSRTIRTEEAVIISLAKLSPYLLKSAHDKPLDEDEPDVEFSDASPSSEESSDEDSESAGGNRSSGDA